MHKPEPDGMNSDNAELAALVRGETDAGLLSVMADRERDLALAGAAFQEFYARNSNYVWKACWNAAQELGGEALVEELFRGTFDRVFDKAGRFELPAGISPERSRRLVLGWVGTIASNLFRDHLRAHGREVKFDDDGWERLADSVGMQCGECNAPLQPANSRQELLNAAWDTLTEREQVVLRTTFQFYRVGKEYQRLPNKEAAELAESLGTTPENVRQIRSRALLKLKTFVNQKSINSVTGR